MASFLALDYGAQSVRLMEFDGSVRKLRVLKVVDVDLRVASLADVTLAQLITRFGS